MRITNWLCLAVLCLVVGNLPPLAAGHDHRRPAAGPKKTPVQEEKTLIHEEFTGYGKSEFAARKDALNNACTWLKQYKYGELNWSPDADYLLEHKMVQFYEWEDKKFDEPMGVMKVVKMQLAITDSQDRDIHKQAQHQRMKERHKQAFLVLLGAMGLLSVVGGYLRLEEATKGYYTRLLRIAAISILVVLVAGLCVAG
jgi:hypothetical protein